jgi:hypothetical protein
MAHLRQRLQQGNAAYLDLIKFAYFAKGCHIINIGQADAIVQHSRSQFGFPSAPWNMAYEPDMRQATGLGIPTLPRNFEWVSDENLNRTAINVSNG